MPSYRLEGFVLDKYFHQLMLAFCLYSRHDKLHIERWTNAEAAIYVVNVQCASSSSMWQTPRELKTIKVGGSLQVLSSKYRGRKVEKNYKALARRLLTWVKKGWQWIPNKVSFWTSSSWGGGGPRRTLFFCQAISITSESQLAAIERLMHAWWWASARREDKTPKLRDLRLQPSKFVSPQLGLRSHMWHVIEFQRKARAHLFSQFLKFISNSCVRRDLESKSLEHLGRKSR